MSTAAFKAENDQLLINTVNTGFIDYWATGKKTIRQGTGIEVYITPECNQNCSYCYLCSHGDELYPKDIRNHDTILKNYKMFLDYCVEKKLKPENFDLFSGEIWQSDFGITILEMLYDCLASQSDFVPEKIMIPSNCSFVLNDKALARIENILQKFNDNDNIKTYVYFSCSNDGYHIDKDTRPYNDPKLQQDKNTQEYYTKILDFCIKWKFAFHPMVSAHCIEKWPENYQWWCDELSARGIDPVRGVMLLETRNDDWTEEKLISYIKFLNFRVELNAKILQEKYPECTRPYEAFYRAMSGKIPKYTNHYDSLKFQNPRDLWPTCSIARSFTVRLGDLAIVPCHRLSYDEFLFGHFTVENDKIVGMTSKNVVMMNQIWLNNLLGASKCGSCLYNSICTRGCYGSQFESNKDFLYPCATVCDLYKVRTIFIYLKYKKIGIWDYPGAKNCESYRIFEKIQNTEEYKKWSKIINNII